jgi:hypothetical protein
MKYGNKIILKEKADESSSYENGNLIILLQEK